MNFLKKDHFLSILNVSDLEISLIDWIAAEKESKILEMEVNKVIEKMLKEGRTCAQLMNANTLIKCQGNDTNVNVDEFDDLNIDKVCKYTLL